MSPNVCRPSGEAALTACLPPDSAQPCVANNDCPNGARCDEKFCRWTCASDAQCTELRAGTCDTARGYCTQRVRAGDTAPSATDAGDASLEASVDVASDGPNDATIESDAPVADSASDVVSTMDSSLMDSATDGPIVCPAGRMDCDGDRGNGCEVDVTSDPNHCGMCGALCNPLPNATRACVASRCAVGSCAAGFGDCDRAVANGCEAALSGNRTHCGRCDNACGPGSFCGPFMGTFACQAADFPPGDAGAPFVPDAGLVSSDGGDAGSTITTLVAGRNVFESVTIPMNAEVRSASGVLEIYADGPVRIDGTIDVSGGRGGNAVPTMGSNSDCRPSGQGGGTGTRVAGITTSGSACPGVATGGSGAAGANAPVSILGCALGGAFGGGNGAAGTPAGAASAGGGGGGYAGGGGGGVRGSTFGGGGASAAGGRGGGGGGTVADAGFGGFGGEYDAPMALSDYAGRNGVRDGTVAPFGGGGGGSIGLDAARDLEVRTTFRPGSGGGGGAFSSCTTGMGGAAGGGGGGGALRIVSNTAIVLGPTARLLATGGAGGSGSAGSSNRSGGGGGSGGVIYLSAPSVVVEPGALVDVRGGAGGAGSAGQNGGDGGLGRVRIAVVPSSCDLRGAFFPGFATGTPCEVSPVGGVAGRTFVGTFPPPAM
ncbi:MAG: hypothetical protein JNK05_17410 [Myxococcales bacterium]|nr:hypothetical protein [Myxococcales bacterium]